MSWAKPPIAAPLFSARSALADSAPKLIAETFSSAMSIGLRAVRAADQHPRRLVRLGTGAVECTRYS